MRKSLVAMVFAAMVATACGGGGGSDDAATTTTNGPGATTSTTKGARNLPDDAPPMIAAAGARPIFDRTPAIDSNYGAYSGPRLPIAFLEDAQARPRVYPATRGDDSTGGWVSPDGTLIAYLVKPDAVTDLRYDLVATDTGEVLEQVEVPLDRVSAAIWSPDSRAFYYQAGSSAGGSAQFLHRVGGQTVQFDAQAGQIQFAFASDESDSKLLRCFGDATLFVATDATGEGEAANQAGKCRSTTQLIDREANPVILYSAQLSNEALELRIIKPGAESAVVPLPPAVAASNRGLEVTGCGTVAIVNIGTAHYLFELESGSFVEVADLDDRQCPIVSPDGSKAALQLFDKRVYVVTFASGEVTEVANSGQPIAFGASGESVLVDANGTFVVPVDGSGGEKASVQATRTSGLYRSYCRAGSTGKVAILEGTQIVVYDIDEDDSFDTVASQLPASCSQMEGDRWFLAGNLLVDLDDEGSWILPAIRIPDGERVPVDGLAPGNNGEYSFTSVATVVSGFSVL